MPNRDVTQLLSNPQAVYIDIIASWVTSKSDCIELPVYLLEPLEKFLLDPAIDILIKTELATMPRISSIVTKCTNINIYKLKFAYNTFLKFLAMQLEDCWETVFNAYQDFDCAKQLRDNCLFFMVASERTVSITACARSILHAETISDLTGPFRAYMLNTYPHCDEYQPNIIASIAPRFVNNDEDFIRLLQLVVEMPHVHVVHRIERLLAIVQSAQVIFVTVKQFAIENPLIFHSEAGYGLLKEIIILLDKARFICYAKELLSILCIKDRFDPATADKAEDVIEAVMHSQISTDLYRYAETLILPEDAAAYTPAYSAAVLPALQDFHRRNSLDGQRQDEVVDIRKLTPPPQRPASAPALNGR